jgi:glycosyltransferase involved in cell wall biosynthesis
MKTVSVIVPAYKADEWIDECLASINSQSYEEIELIQIDDPEGAGPSAARNRGLEEATGEYVAFCDADDYLEPRAIETLVGAMEGVDMVCGSFRKFGDFEMVVRHPNATMSRSDVATYVLSNLRQPRRNQMLSGCWAKLYRRDLLGSFDESLRTAEDMALNFDYLTRCRSVRFVNQLVYNNRKHNGTVTTTFDETNKDALFGFLEGLKYVKGFLSSHYEWHEIEDALDKSKVYHSALYFMRICAQNGGTMRDNFKRLYP